jgi:hypothetical protein
MVMAAGGFGMPRLFEVAAKEQPRTICLGEDDDGNPVIQLRPGAVITRQVVDELNALVAETYFKGRASALASEDASSSPLVPRQKAP